MKKKLFSVGSVLVMTLFMVGCSGKLSVQQYNEKAVTLHTQASTYFDAVVDKVLESDLSLEEKKMLADSVGIKMIDWYNQLKALPYPDVAKDFHQALVACFVFEAEELTPLFQKLLLAERETERDAIMKEFNIRVSKDLELNDAAQKAQAEFAAKNNLQLQ